MKIFYASLLLSFQLLVSSQAANINPPSTKARPPNFVFILTDDQDRVLGETGYTSYFDPGFEVQASSNQLLNTAVTVAFSLFALSMLTQVRFTR